VPGGVGNGYAGVCLSTLLMTRTPESARGRVSATASAVFGAAQGASLLLGGVVAVVLSPRAIYAVAGLLGLAAAGLLAVTSASRASSRATPVDARAV
jgi:MFS family permease